MPDNILSDLAGTGVIGCVLVYMLILNRELMNRLFTAIESSTKATNKMSDAITILTNKINDKILS